MHAYQTDAEGFLIERVALQLDPLESEIQKKPVYLLPAGAVSVAPPEMPPMHEAKWTGAKWEAVESRSEVARKKAEGRVLVNGAWTEPPPSQNHVLEGSAWVLPPEKQAEIDARLSRETRIAEAKASLKNRAQATTVAQLRAQIDDIITALELGE